MYIHTQKILFYTSMNNYKLLLKYQKLIKFWSVWFLKFQKISFSPEIFFINTILGIPDIFQT